ncbi:hypothetical protein, partial [Prevotellamassilia timonensis]|uniref:hypothetical protein n=1 Tax=Prevotellamassilia timonensis TaxID=1852370 RepID=UPI0040296D5F
LRGSSDMKISGLYSPLILLIPHFAVILDKLRGSSDMKISGLYSPLILHISHFAVILHKVLHAYII